MLKKIFLFIVFTILCININSQNNISVDDVHVCIDNINDTQINPHLFLGGIEQFGSFEYQITVRRGSNGTTPNSSSCDNVDTYLQPWTFTYNTSNPINNSISNLLQTGNMPCGDVQNAIFQMKIKLLSINGSTTTTSNIENDFYLFIYNNPTAIEITGENSQTITYSCNAPTVGQIEGQAKNLYGLNNNNIYNLSQKIKYYVSGNSNDFQNATVVSINEEIDTDKTYYLVPAVIDYDNYNCGDITPLEVSVATHYTSPSNQYTLSQQQPPLNTCDVSNLDSEFTPIVLDSNGNNVTGDFKFSINNGITFTGSILQGTNLQSILGLNSYRITDNFQFKLSLLPDSNYSNSCVDEVDIAVNIRNEYTSTALNIPKNEINSRLDSPLVNGQITYNTILELFKKKQGYYIADDDDDDVTVSQYDDYDFEVYEQNQLNEYIQINNLDLPIPSLSGFPENNPENCHATLYFNIIPPDGNCAYSKQYIPYTLNITDIPPLTTDQSFQYLCLSESEINALDSLNSLNLDLNNQNSNGFEVWSEEFLGVQLNINAIKDMLNSQSNVTIYIANIDLTDEIGCYTPLPSVVSSYKRIPITITKECPPTCPQPTLQPITEFTDTTATLNWTVNGDEDLWQIEYGFSGFTQGEGSTVIANTFPFTVNGLVPANSYDFYIRAICSATDMSFWDGEETVTTDCANCTSFKPEPNKKYVLSAWVKEDHLNVTTTSFDINTEYVKEMLNDLVLKYQTDQIILNGYTNTGLENLKSHHNLYSSSLNTNAAIYDFNFSTRRGYRFKFSDDPSAPYHFFKINLPIVESANGTIVSVTIDENAADQTSFVLGIDFNDDGASDYNQIYSFGENTYRSSVTSSTSNQVMNYNDTYLKITFFDGTDALVGNPNQVEFNTSGDIIDGWQRIQGEFTIPIGTVKLNIDLINDFAGDAYFDDVRIFPSEGNMKSFVYDQQTQRLMAELDENNYATFYEYDKEGGLIRVKKETTKGIFTIQETRSGNVKK